MGPTRHGGSIKSCVEREKVSAAAKHFNVPRKTLDDRVRSDMHGSNPDPSTDEENALASYLYTAERGFPLTTKMVQVFAWSGTICSGKHSRFNEETDPRKPTQANTGGKISKRGILN